jgi:hypothetical protein
MTKTTQGLNNINFFENGEATCWSYRQFQIGQDVFISGKQFMIVEVNPFDIPNNIRLTDLLVRLNSDTAFSYYLKPIPIGGFSRLAMINYYKIISLILARQ